MRPIDVTAPPSFAAKARWVIQSFLDASAADASAEPVRYPSSALAGSEAAVAWFAEAGGRPPASASDGLIDFGDGVEDIVASAFWHLSRWEERDGSPRDRHGRFTAAFSAVDPERPGGAAGRGGPGQGSAARAARERRAG